MTIGGYSHTVRQIQTLQMPATYKGELVDMLLTSLMIIRKPIAAERRVTSPILLQSLRTSEVSLAQRNNSGPKPCNMRNYGKEFQAGRVSLYLIGQFDALANVQDFKRQRFVSRQLG